MTTTTQRTVKCVVWDLDNTLWEGTLLEGAAVALRPGAAEIVTDLDRRGVLQSIASRNDPDAAMAALERLGLAGYFVHPQIGWGAKSEAVRRILDLLGIAEEHLALVDDQPFERDEVAFALPAALCLDHLQGLDPLTWDGLVSKVVSPDGRLRRQRYLDEERRIAAQKQFDGPPHAFLETLDMRFTVWRAGPGDLLRAVELNERTNQLNSTAYRYTMSEMEGLLASPDHLVLLAALEDVYGQYGTIGLAIIEIGGGAWTVKQLAMSCRVIARGINTVLVDHIRRRARDAGVRLSAEFVRNGRNDMLHLALLRSRFRPVAGNGTLLECSLHEKPTFPTYVRVQAHAP